MYLKGLRALNDGETDYSIFTGETPTATPDAYPDVTYTSPATPTNGTYPVVTAPSNTPPTNNDAWTGVVKQAISTFGDMFKVSTQSKAQVATAPYSYRYPYGGYYQTPGAPLVPGTAPFASPFPVSGGTLLVGGALIAAFLLLKG